MKVLSGCSYAIAKVFSLLQQVWKFILKETVHKKPVIPGNLKFP